MRGRRAAIALGIVLVLALGGYLMVRRALGSDFVRVQLEQQLSARLRQPVHIRAATATIFPGIAVDLHGVSIGARPDVVLGRVRVLTGLRALFADVIDIRDIKVWDGRAGTRGQTFAFDLDASVVGDRLDVRSLTARGATTTIHATGALTSIANMQGTFDATSDLLDVNELIAIAGAVTPPQRNEGAGGSARASQHVVVRIAARAVRFGTYAFRDLTATADGAAGRVSLEPLSAGLFRGTFTGRLDADTAGAVPVLRLSGDIANVDVAELLEKTGSAGGITGRLGGRVSVVATGADGAALVRTAHGTITAVVRNGTMPRLDLVRTLVLAFGKPAAGAPSGLGTAFDSLGGTFVLAGGTLTSQNVSLRSRDVDTNGRGSLVVETGVVDAQADVVLSPELTAQAGTDLRRYAQEDGRVIVPATLSGTLDRPRVFVDVAAAARRAIGNELQRRATSFLGGLFKKKKKGGG